MAIHEIQIHPPVVVAMDANRPTIIKELVANTPPENIINLAPGEYTIDERRYLKVTPERTGIAVELKPQHFLRQIKNWVRRRHQEELRIKKIDYIDEDCPLVAMGDVVGHDNVATFRGGIVPYTNTTSQYVDTILIWKPDPSSDVQSNPPSLITAR